MLMNRALKNIILVPTDMRLVVNVSMEKLPGHALAEQVLLVQ